MAFRYKRIISEPSTLVKRLGQLRDKLLERKYKPKVIDTAFARVSGIKREETLKKVAKNKTNRTAFVTTFDPRLPNIGSVIHSVDFSTFGP